MSRQREVILHLFRTLHRTVDKVFQNDPNALLAARERINSDFKKNKAVSSDGAVDDLVKLGVDCNRVLLEQVLQVQLQPKTGRYPIYRANIRKEMKMFENFPFREASLEEYRRANKRGKIRCDEVTKATDAK